MPTEHGDAEVARTGEILRTVVGSELFGLALPEANSDHDEMGIYLEPPSWVLGFQPHREDYVWRTSDEGQRSGDGDTDSISYSLRKYLQLATKGNPTILLPLFAPTDQVLNITSAGIELRAMRSHFLSVHAVHRFLGYLRGQVQRIEGQSKKHVPNRPELIEKYGWDTKYGSHALRLALQGRELARFGTLTLPMPVNEREWVLGVKLGQHSQAETLTWVKNIAANVETIVDHGDTPLPAEPNISLITDWAVETQKKFWDWDCTSSK